ncbi:MAG: hypothetical protein QM698_15770 [Micropepsaceae bacterium]
MRIVIAAVAAASFIGTASAADNCAQTRMKDLTFGGDRTLTVTASSIANPTALEGDNCRNATVVLTVHTEGQLVAAYAAAAVYANYDFGHTEAPVPAAKLGAYLDSWIDLKMSTSDTAPAIGEGVTTGLSAEDYEAIKASKAPMFCFEKSAFETSCFAPDSSGYIIEFFEREET